MAWRAIINAVHILRVSDSAALCDVLPCSCSTYTPCHRQDQGTEWSDGAIKSRPGDDGLLPGQVGLFRASQHFSSTQIARCRPQASNTRRNACKVSLCPAPAPTNAGCMADEQQCQAWCGRAGVEGRGQPASAVEGHLLHLLLLGNPLPPLLNELVQLSPSVPDALDEALLHLGRPAHRLHFKIGL